MYQIKLMNNSDAESSKIIVLKRRSSSNSSISFVKTSLKFLRSSCKFKVNMQRSDSLCSNCSPSCSLKL